MRKEDFHRQLADLTGQRAGRPPERPPGSAHRPTVAQGRALVLYLLPEGQIQFTTT